MEEGTLSKPVRVPKMRKKKFAIYEGIRIYSFG